MKKYIPVALLAVLSGFQLVSGAQTAQVDGAMVSPSATVAERQALRQEMQQKMAAAKSDAERQQIMTEQQQKMHGTPGTHGMQGMQGMQGRMNAPMHAQMAAHDPGQMRGMPMMQADMAKHRQMMQEHMTK